MKSESTIMPVKPFEIEILGENCNVRFFENVEVVKSQDEENEELQKYIYDEYLLTVRYRDNLENIIEQNLQAWIEKAKEEEKKTPPETDKEKMLRLEKENKMLEGTIMELTSLLSVLAGGV